MSFVGIQQWVSQQGGSLLLIALVIGGLIGFFKKDFKYIFILAGVGGFVYLLITQGQMIMRVISNVFRMIFGG
ncbi:hypothetical protein ACRHK7_06605 [Weissella tructae]|uniref:hypothetical protein n=1 Tax=Weissella tructae TaxID=887702 RepID=UPI003D939966